MPFKKYFKKLIKTKQNQWNCILKHANLIKYGLIKEVNLTIIIFKKWLKDNDIEMYSIHNEGKSVVVERLYKNLEIYDFDIEKCLY